MNKYALETIGIFLLAPSTSVGFAASAHAQQPAEANADEIIVTAQRRAQNVQDVPIAVTAFGPQQLQSAGISGSGDLTFVTPGLNVSRTLNFAQPVIRGVGTASTSPGDEANVATYIDGVYIPQMTAAFYDFNSISSVEVLKGPQGTLFGRNATGGAVNVTTRDPSADPHIDLEATYGRFDERTFKGYATAGVGNLAANISVIQSNRDGYIRDIVADQRRAGWDKTLVRGKILFEPTDAITLTLAADYARIDDDTGLIVSPVDGNTLGRRLGFAVPAGDYEAAQSFAPSSKLTQYGGSFKGEFDLGAVKLVSITAYRHNRIRNIADTDASPAPLLRIDNTEISRATSQEIQLLSNNGSRFNWILGGFYFHNRAGHEPLIVNLGTATINQQTVNSYAAFADGTFDITPSLSLTGGLRYSSERRTLSGTRGNVVPAGIPASRTFDNLSPRIVLSFKPTADSMLYASYSKGFKSGTFNVSGFSPLPVDPEKLTSYEIGYKLRLGPGITWNSSAFYYEYRGLQVQILDPNNGLSLLQNAANARMEGVDSDFTARISDRLSVRAAVAYLHSRYRDFKNALVTVPTGLGGNAQVRSDVSGNELIRAPDISVTVGMNYKVPLADGSSIELANNLFFSGDYFWDVGNRLRENSYEVLNSQISWRSANDRWRVTVWAKNLTGAHYREQVATSTLADYGRFAAPPQFGITVGTSYP